MAAPFGPAMVPRSRTPRPEAAAARRSCARKPFTLRPAHTRRRSPSAFAPQPVIELALIDLTNGRRIPCTSATRTVIDCAEYLDPEALEVAFESARRMGLTSPRALAQRADALCGRGKPGSAAIKTLLSHQRDRDPALQFRLEVKTARLLRAHKLPTPVRQFATREVPRSTSRIRRSASDWSAKASSTTATGSPGSETSAGRLGSKRRIGACCSSPGTT